MWLIEEELVTVLKMVDVNKDSNVGDIDDWVQWDKDQGETKGQLSSGLSAYVAESEQTFAALAFSRRRCATTRQLHEICGNEV